MIIGIGTDLIELERIKEACEKGFFVKKAYTVEENRQAEGRISFLAGNFATKESVAKALGTGFRNFSLKDIEVLRDNKGKPYINLYGNAKKIYDELNIKNIQVSISNTKDYAIAFVVMEN